MREKTLYEVMNSIFSGGANIKQNGKCWIKLHARASQAVEIDFVQAE